LGGRRSRRPRHEAQRRWRYKGPLAVVWGPLPAARWRFWSGAAFRCPGQAHFPAAGLGLSAARPMAGFPA